jgi:hypothetical protein
LSERPILLSLQSHLTLFGLSVGEFGLLFHLTSLGLSGAGLSLHLLLTRRTTRQNQSRSAPDTISQRLGTYTGLGLSGFGLLFHLTGLGLDVLGLSLHVL